MVDLKHNSSGCGAVGINFVFVESHALGMPLGLVENQQPCGCEAACIQHNHALDTIKPGVYGTTGVGYGLVILVRLALQWRI